MDTTLELALAQPSSTVFLALELVLPAVTVRVSSGAVQTFDVDGTDRTFIPFDPVFGALASLESVSDGAGARASALRLRVGLLPPSADAVTQLAAPGAQGSRARLWFGALNSAGTVEGAPELLADVELDFSRVMVGPSARIFYLDLRSPEELQLEPNAQQRLSDAFHSTIWPGENGLRHVPQSVRQIFWRLSVPQGSAISAGGGSVGETGNLNAVFR